MRALLLVAADPREFRGILRHCRGVRRLHWPLWLARQAELNGRRLVLVADGPGELAARAAEMAIRKEEVEAVVSTGFCGALDPTLTTGDILVGPGRRPSTSRPYRLAALLSTDHVVATAEEKKQLYAAGAAAVEMEAAALEPLACRHGVPFYSIRVVMDGADQDLPLDFDRLRDAKGRFSRARILGAALARPLRAVPALFRLERQGRLAARALGDFFADCRF